MKKLSFLFLTLATVSVLIGCNEPEEPSKEEKQTKQDSMYTENEHGKGIEAYIAKIDSNQNLAMGSSLDYTHKDGHLFWVDFVVNDSSQIVRMNQYYTTSQEGSILSNVFYYRNGVVCSTKEYFEEGVGENAKFVERVTYYDEDGKAMVTKKRSAPYEELLVEEVFKVAETHICSDAQAFRALNQEGEFETKFKGIVATETANYIVVGEDNDKGYSSSLLVQHYTPMARKLIDNEDTMLGTDLQVEFEKVNDPTGFTFQLLLDVNLAETKEVVKKVN